MAQKVKEQNINVYIRVRPNTEREKQSKYGLIFDTVSKKEIVLKNAYAKKYHFDRIFDENATQNDIYNMIVRPLIPEVLGGYNCTVFAYGQTGTGKTYTMTGGTGIHEGIIPRTFNHIFDILGNLNTESTVRVSYIQLYNEEVIDMLSASDKPIRIYEDKNQKGSVILHDVEEVSVSNKDQIYKLLERGAEKRKTASTLMNANSSRSHTVFTIIIHTRETTPTGEELVKTGKINLVDLAGSENILRSGSLDKRAREAGSINQSLLTLGRVIKALTEKNAHIPYRESKLTRLLQDSLGGSTKTSLIATISASTANSEETLSTLDYAIRAKCVTNCPQINQKVSRTALLKQYFEEIERLKKDLHAAQTGSGIMLDEENYKMLMEQNETQRTDLVTKMSAIRNLQVTLDEKNHALQTLQESWTAAANNVELLKREQFEKEQQLEEFKIKTKNLEKKTSIFYQNSETLHEKLSYLYKTSNNNRDISKVFIDAYNKLNNELMYHIDESVMTVHGFTEISLKSLLKSRKEELEERYMAIRTCLQNIVELNTEINLYKTQHFTKSSDQKGLPAIFDQFQTDTDNINAQVVSDVSRLIDETIPELKSCIENLSTETGKEFTEMLLMLRDIRTHSTLALSSMLNELTNFLHSLLEHNQAILKKTEEHCKQLTLNKTTISNMKANMFTMFSEMEKMEEIAIAQNNEITDAIQNVQTFVNRSSDSLTSNIEHISDTNEDNFNKHVDSIANLIDKNLINSKECSLQQVQRYEANVEKAISNIDDRFKSSKANIADLRTVCIEKEKTLHTLIKCSLDTCQNMSSNGVDAMKALDEFYTKQQTESKNFKHKISLFRDSFDSTVKNMINNCKRKLNDTVHFCSQQLNHPTHAGDTPQRVSSRFLDLENVTPNIPDVLNNRDSAKASAESANSGIRCKQKQLWKKQNSDNSL